MQMDSKQKYGLFVPSLNTFLSIEATRKEFELILKELNLDYS